MPASLGVSAEITQRIRILYKRAGTVALARAAGVSTETVRRYLRGHSPSAHFLQRLCEELGISGDWLLRGVGPPSVQELPQDALRSASGIQLVLALGAALDGLSERVGRVESFARRLEHLAGAEPEPPQPQIAAAPTRQSAAQT